MEQGNKIEVLTDKELVQVDGRFFKLRILLNHWSSESTSFSMESPIGSSEYDVIATDGLSFRETLASHQNAIRAALLCKAV